MLVSRYHPDKEVLENQVPDIIRGYISRGAFVIDRQDTEDGSLFSIGISYPEIIVDRDSSPIITYVPIRGVANATIRKEGATFHLTIPERVGIFKTFNRKKRDLVRRAENLIIQSGADKLVDIPLVQNGLNPIKEILFALNEMDRIPVREVLARKKNKTQMKRYIDMLKSLRYVDEEDGVLHPGSELEKINIVSADDFHRAVMTDVIRKGFPFIREELNIYILNPYLELTNSYYLPSLLAREKVQMEADDIFHYYIKMYGTSRRKPIYQVAANLVEMVDVGLLKKDGGLFEGDDELFTSLTDNFGVSGI
jgi:hypothetical protein